ncbi:MAG: phytanoyl-CoA dioxygenase [Myxococcales bacterium]|nr:MAG: phytanoyl-CoA dioxygenase [Myxococcales bacterium]
MLRPEAAALDLTAVLHDYRTHGYARLGPVLDEPALAALRARSDDLMLGRVVYPGLFFQHDTATGRYDDLEFGKGWQGPSLRYRKIEKIESDPLFWALLTNPLFERIARAVLGDAVSLYRAVLFAKAARGGTVLPWHQDAGRFWGLDRDPELQIWVALDDAPADAGCVEVLPGSHHAGLVTPLGGLVPADRAAARHAEADAVPVPARAGEAMLIHNLMWHRSGVNTTDRPRRAFTACYLHGATRCTRTKRAPRSFTRVF